MAKSRGWSRYEPPQRPRTETGRLEDDQSPDQRIPASTKSSTGRATRKTASTSTGKKSTGTKSTGTKPTGTKSSGAPVTLLSSKAVWRGVLGAMAALVVVIAVVAGVRGGDDDGPSGAYDTETLDRSFIAESLQLAADQAPQGSQPVGVELNEYELRVEYFDANREQTKYLVRSLYDVDSDGYSIDVRASYYDDYAPRPIDLDRITPAALIDAARTALDEAEDPYSWAVEVSADYDSGEVSMTARAYGDESSEITTPVS